MRDQYNTNVPGISIAAIPFRPVPLIFSFSGIDESAGTCYYNLRTDIAG